MSKISYTGKDKIIQRIIEEINRFEDGSVEDVKVNDVSVVDEDGIANIDLSGYTTAEELAEALIEYSKTTEFASVAFSGEYRDLSNPPSIPAKTSDLQNDGDGTSIFTTKSYVDTAIENLPEPMIFKGTLGTGGTITTLPTASSQNEGFTYKVITDGTYASQDAKVGDVFISNGSSWVLIPSGDTDSDTWREIKINGNEFLGNAISTGAVNFKSGTNTTVSGSGHDIQIDAVVPTKTSDLSNDGEDGTNVFVADNDSRLSDSRTPKSHTHGSITNGGAITSNTTIENTDRLVFVDANDSNKLKRASVAFDGSTTTKALTQKGTFETFAKAADITNAINDLDGGTIGTPGTGKTLTALSQSNGNINATFSDISISKSQAGLGNVDNTSDTTKKTNFTGSIASGNTGFVTGGDVYTALSGKPDVNTIPCAYCDTAGSATAKLASCTDFVLTQKTYLHVLIKNENTKAGKITLNVNGTGAKNIWINGTVTSTTNYTLPAGTYIVYYDGSKYLFRTDGKLVTKDMIDGLANVATSGNYSDLSGTPTIPTKTSDLTNDGSDGNTPFGTSNLALGESSTTAYRGDRGKTAYNHATDSSKLTTAIAAGLYKVGCTTQGHISELTAVTKADITALGIPGSDTNTIPSGYCTTAAATAAKEASCTGYNLTSKTYLQIIITNTNTAQEKLTLSVNGKTAKDIWINGTVTSSENYSLTKGSYIVYYDGSKYLFRTDGKLVTTSQIASFPSNMSTSELTTGTATTARTMRADYLKTGINQLIAAFEASKSCIVGSDASANLYFHVCTIRLEDLRENTDISVMFSVNNTFSSNTATKEGAGILYMHFRAKTTSPMNESMALKFVSSVNFNNDDFKLGWGQFSTDTGTGIQYELWTKIDTRWMFRRFTILSQGYRKHGYDNIITLDSDTTGSSTLPARISTWISAS